MTAPTTPISLRASRNGLTPIMRAEHEIRLHAFREKWRASQMDCIERIDGRPHWLARPAQD